MTSDVTGVHYLEPMRKISNQEDQEWASLRMTVVLKAENYKILPHSLFSPDMVPFDYFLFNELKCKMLLPGKKYKSLRALSFGLYISLIFS